MEIQECRELLEQVRQRQEEQVRRQVQQPAATLAPGGSSSPSTSPTCVPRAITNDMDTPNSSPIAALLGEVATERAKDVPFVFGSSSDHSSCVSPAQLRKPKAKASKQAKTKKKSSQQHHEASKRESITDAQFPKTPEKEATLDMAASLEGPVPGTGSSRKRGNNQVSTCKQPSILLSKPKQHDYQPTPKKQKEGDSISGIPIQARESGQGGRSQGCLISLL